MYNRDIYTCEILMQQYINEHVLIIKFYKNKSLE